MVKSGTVNGKDVTYEKDEYGTWICVMNYEHLGGNDPSVSPGDTFPQLPNGKTTPSDINNLGSNGELRHVDKITQYGTWNVDAVKIEGRTDNHSRTMRYFTENQAMIDAVVQTETTNETSPSDWSDQTTFYSDHDANLPDAGNNSTSSNANRIFGEEFPLYLGGEYHWALSGNGNRWEVDDYPNDDSNTTIHRVWVRVPDSTFPLEVKLTEDITLNDFKTVFLQGDTTILSLTERIDVEDSLSQTIFRGIEKTLTEAIDLSGIKLLETTSLTGYYSLNQTLKDKLNNVKATNFGSSYTVDGVNGTYAATFNASNSEYIETNDQSFPDWYNDKPMSYSLWLRTSSQGVALGLIGGNDPSNAQGHVPAITVDGNSNGKANGIVGYHSNTNWVNSTTTVKDGNWHHIVVTYNPSTDNEIIYVDGEQEGSRTQSGTNDFNSGDYSFLLGTEILGSSSWRDLTSTNFNGEVDEFRVYSKELSSSEVSTIYNKQTLESDTASSKTLKTLSQSISLATQKTEKLQKKLSDTVQPSDTTSKLFEGFRTLSDTFTVQDSDIKGLNRIIQESLSLNDVNSTTATLKRTFQDSFSISDSLNQRVFKKLQEQLNPADAKSLAFSKPLEENPAITTQLTKETRKSLNETTSINEALNKKPVLKLDEKILVQDNNYSLRFDGTGADYFTPPSSTSVENAMSGETATVSFWVSLGTLDNDWATWWPWTATNELGNQRARLENTGTNDNIYIRWIVDPSSSGFNTGDGGIWARGIPDIQNDGWVLHTSVFESTDTGFSVRTYINGQLEDKQTGSDSNAVLGAASNIGDFTPREDPHKIDDFRVYNSALTLSDVQKLYKRRYRDDVDPSNLALWYKMNEGKGDRLKDFSNNDNTGTLTASTWINSPQQRITTKLLKQLSETLNISENISKQIKLDKTENTNLSDSLTKTATLYREYSQSIIVQDSDILQYYSNLDQNISLGDTSKRITEAERTLSENTVINTNVIRKTFKSLEESIDLQPSIKTQLNAFRQLSETTTINDTATSNIASTLETVNLAETLALNDTTQTKTNLYRTNTEQIQTQDAKTKTTLKTLTQSLTIQENTSKTLSRKLTQTLSIQDIYNRALTKGIELQETTTIKDNRKITLSKTLSKTLNVTTEVATNITSGLKKANPQETLTINTSISQNATLKRILQETITIQAFIPSESSFRRTVLSHGLTSNIAKTTVKYNNTKIISHLQKLKAAKEFNTADSLINANQYKSEKRKYNTVEQV